jgi:hypothetical protein|tara:strand:+ start:37221 stop:37628 length:408 start_codon:yes stop_codon:yes gene_type:complete
MTMDELNKLGELLYGPGEAMQGTEMSVEDAIEFVQERYPSRPFCLVRDWIWIDLELPDRLIQEVQNDQQQPVLLYAHNVVHDYAERFPAPGSYVRTTLLVSFSEGFVFQTRNTVYVLLGTGKRKRAKPDVLRGLF